MTLNINPNEFWIFDLDDTLYKEVDFLRSAYKYLASQFYQEIGYDLYEEMVALYYSGESTFDIIKEKYKLSISIEEMVYAYRHHFPIITLLPGSKNILLNLQENNIPLGIITDGRSASQRNKISALGIMPFLRDIIISEEYGSGKPSLSNFQYFTEKYPNYNFTYVGDNIKKDFISPNLLGWRTIGLKDDGRNIHTQNVAVEKSYLPSIWLNSFEELQLNFIN